MFASRAFSVTAALALALAASATFAFNGSDGGCVPQPGSKLVNRPTTAALPVFPGESGCIKARPVKPFPTSGVTVAGLFDRPAPVRTPTAVAAVRG